ncbi:hypothetical protein [Streptomyces sp. cg35]|uniref:hypothetical protein n=1 Tax=Streptomyces sp. cg35 TaxID=3421650 RepID=UPI003D1799EE
MSDRSDRPTDVRQWPEAEEARIVRGDLCPGGYHDPQPTMDGFCGGCLEMIEHAHDLGLI